LTGGIAIVTHDRGGGSDDLGAVQREREREREREMANVSQLL
jgi:hypothetical protein